MGNIFSTVSDLVEKEKTSWVRPHKLEYRQDLRNEQLELIPKFGQKLEIRFRECRLYGVTYKHYWITDGTWILEWGGGDVLRPNILVHCNSANRFGTIEKRFDKTREVEERMKELCGASNYSLALRNCEHAARYVHVGGWLCFQMVAKGVLKEEFFKHMSQFTKLINIAPDELQKEELVNDGPIYDEIANDETSEVKFEFVKKGTVMDGTQRENYTILFLGPTGRGFHTQCAGGPSKPLQPSS